MRATAGSALKDALGSDLTIGPTEPLNGLADNVNGILVADLEPDVAGAGAVDAELTLAVREDGAVDAHVDGVVTVGALNIADDLLAVADGRRSQKR